MYGFPDVVVSMVSNRGSGVLGRWLGVLACAGVLFGAGVPSAYAADDAGGLWAVENPSVDALHRDGIDGNGVRIALIGDTPVVNNPDIKDANLTTGLAKFTQYSAKGFTQGGSCMISGQPLAGEEKYSTRDAPVLDENGKQDGDRTVKEYVPDSRYTSVSTEALKWFAGAGTGYDGARDVRGIAPKSSIATYAYTGIGAVGCDASGDTHTRLDVDATVYDAVQNDARIVDMQVGNPVSYGKYKGFMTALRHGVIIVNANTGSGGAGSRAYTGDPHDPSMFPGVLMVSPVNPDGSIVGDVKNASITVGVPGGKLLNGDDSTKRDVRVQDAVSMSPAIVSAYMALMMQKYPDATGNQVLQALVRSAANADDGAQITDLKHNDSTGYGVIDLKRFYDTDPTKLPDINPILEAQVKNALNDPYAQRWLSQDCTDNPDGMLVDGSLTDTIACDTNAINAEYKRQVAAWDKVEQCQKDNGPNCMRLSATNTADEADKTNSGTTTDTTKDNTKEKSMDNRMLLIGVLIIGVLIICAGIILTLRNKRNGKGKTAANNRKHNAGKRTGKHGTHVDAVDDVDTVDDVHDVDGVHDADDDGVDGYDDDPDYAGDGYDDEYYGDEPKDPEYDDGDEYDDYDAPRNDGYADGPDQSVDEEYYEEDEYYGDEHDDGYAPDDDRQQEYDDGDGYDDYADDGDSYGDDTVLLNTKHDDVYDGIDDDHADSPVDSYGVDTVDANGMSMPMIDESNYDDSIFGPVDPSRKPTVGYDSGGERPTEHRANRNGNTDRQHKPRRRLSRDHNAGDNAATERRRIQRNHQSSNAQSGRTTSDAGTPRTIQRQDPAGTTGRSGTGKKKMHRRTHRN